ERRPECGADPVNLMARVAMVLLVDRGALSRKRRCSQQCRLVLWRQCQDEEGKCVQIGVGQTDGGRGASRHYTRWILEVRNHPSCVSMVLRHFREVRADAVLAGARMAAH